MVGGLTQLDRLRRNVAEAWPGAALVVAEAGEGGRGRERAGEFGAAGAGTVLLVSTDLVVGRGVLPRLAAAAEAGRPVPVRILRGEEVAPDGRLVPGRLAALLPANPLPASEETGFYMALGPGTPPRTAERALLASLGKPSDGYVARHLNRAVSLRLTALLAATRVTPNMVSLGVLALALGAAWQVALGTPAGFMLGCLLNQCASMLDGTDGELARLKFLESRQGAWLDTVIDLLGNHLFIVAMGIGLSRQPGLDDVARTGYLVEGAVTTLGSAGCLAAIAWFTRRTSGDAHFNNFSAPLRNTEAGGWLRRAFAAAVPLFRRDAYALIFLGLALLGRPAWVLHGLALGVAIHVPAIAWVWWRHHPIAAPARQDGGTAHA
jgi:hypothetical protein